MSKYLITKSSLKMSILFLLFIIFIAGSMSVLEATGNNVVSIETENDIIKIMGDVHVPENEVVDGNVVAIIGDIKVDGHVSGDVVSVLGDIELNNIVEGDLVSVIGEVTRGPDSQVVGEITRISIGDLNFRGIVSRNFRRMWFDVSRGMFNIFRLIVLFGLALLVFALMPDKQKNMAQVLNTSLLRRILIGLIAFICLPVVVLLFMISIIGIPAVPFLIMGFFVINFIGYVAIVYYTGKKIAAISEKEINIYLIIFLGVLVLWILNIIPFLGFIFRLLILFLALGVVIDTKFGTNRPWFKSKEEIG